MYSERLNKRPPPPGRPGRPGRPGGASYYESNNVQNMYNYSEWRTPYVHLNCLCLGEVGEVDGEQVNNKTNCMLLRPFAVCGYLWQHVTGSDDICTRHRFFLRL